MHRRTYLGSLVATSATSLSGCLDAIARLDSSDDPDGDIGTIPEDPRIDEPPHDIIRPELDDDLSIDERREQWDAHYLGEHSPNEPTLAFDYLDDVDNIEGGGVDVVAGGSHIVSVYEDISEVKAQWEDREPLFGENPPLPDAFEAIDFDEQIVVYVAAGGGSGSTSIRWARIESNDDTIHLHGYVMKPYVQTSDWRPRTSTVVVDRPSESLKLARASITTGEQRRVNFNSTEEAIMLNGE